MSQTGARTYATLFVMKRTRTAKKNRFAALKAGFAAGLMAPASFPSAHQYAYAAGSDLSRLREDVEWVGQSFRDVIAREQEAVAKRR